MRILITIPSLPPAGGAEMTAWELAKELANNHDVSIISFHRKKEKANHINENVAIYCFPYKKHNLRYYLTSGRKDIKDIVAQIKPDVIFSHLTSILAYILRNSNAKKIVTIHNSEYKYYVNSLSQKIKHFFITREVVKNYDVVTTVSMHMQSYLNNYFKKEVLFIPNGVNSIFLENIRTLITNKSIIYVGRLNEDKGVLKIFDLAEKLTDYTFNLIGDGPLKDTCSLPNVNFLGKIANDLLPDYYSSSRFAIFPSQYENFPLVGLEAMACGCVVIAYADGFKEYIQNGRNGYIVDDFINESLKIINDYEKNSTEQVLIYEAINDASKYSWNIVANKYLETFH